MKKWLMIWMLFFMVVSFAFVSTLIIFKLERRVYRCEILLEKSRAHTKILYDDKVHLNRRVMRLEQPHLVRTYNDPWDRSEGSGE